MIINLTLDRDDIVLPCPFCGGTTISLRNTHTAAYWLSCDEPLCGAEVHGKAYGIDTSSDQLTLRQHTTAKHSAIGRWNRREGAGQ